MTLSDTRVAVIGLGLLGGSFGLALRQVRAVREVTGVDVSRDILDRACERGAIDRGVLDVEDAVVAADLVVMATPVRTILAMLPQVTACMADGAILFDLGSTKREIRRALELSSPRMRYVGGHPMAGAEQEGIDAADGALFAGATFALVPPTPPDDEALALLGALIRRIGAHPVALSADRHDRIVAMTSHVPYLLSVALVGAADGVAHEEHRLRDFAAGGFRDTSRVAASNVRVMTDICLTNRAPILEGLARAQAELDRLTRHIRDGDEAALESVLCRAKRVRTQMFGERGSRVPAKKVGFQGERGAFSEIAALEYFGDEAEPVPQPAFEDAFNAVEQGHCDYGMLPIENSLAGSIHVNYDLLLQHNLWIVGEIKLRIVHNLLVNDGVTPGDVRKVQSHPKALEQCVAFFRAHPGIKAEPVYDTAGAAKMLKESGARDTGVIASTRAAAHYGLEMLQKGIEDDAQNYTRFLVLAPQPGTPQGELIKTTIVFSVPNVPGSLFRAMSVFALRDIDICKIESRPLIGTPWDYFFYLDFRGREDSLPCSRALNHLQEITAYFKLLGSYEEGRTVG